MILYVDPDLYIMQRAGVRDGNVEQSGRIYVLNNLGDKWSGATAKTKWKNQKFVPVAWDGHDTAAPNALRALMAEASFPHRRAAMRSMHRHRFVGGA
jgi:hypothetical protein